VLRDAGLESIAQDPKGSLLRYLEHLMTVFDYGNPKLPKISNLRELGRAFVRERTERYSRYAEKGLPLPTEGDLIPSTSLFASQEGRRSDNWFGLPMAVREWKLPALTWSPETAERLRASSRKFIPNYYWFLFGALGLLFASLTGPVDWRIPFLTAVSLISLLATLFGSVQWEFRYPFDPIFTAFAVHASFCLAKSLSRRRRSVLAERLSTLLRRAHARLRGLKLVR
jgi:hypothetical protein